MEELINWDDNFDNIEIQSNIDDNAPQWDIFIDQIIQGNVIPVIGPEILCENYNPHKKLLKYFINQFKIDTEINSFSELINNDNFTNNGHREKDYIYSYINQLLSKTRFSPSQLLKEILSIKQFPFIITTSFIPIIENTLKDMGRKNLRVMVFNNNPIENQDIQDDIDLRTPTIYYMFGRVGDSAHRYVVTDIDMLDFCSSWIADTQGRPGNLVSCLRNKYLLMLGNSYSDWLFRFIWYSLRKSGSGSGLYAYEYVEDELSRFLQRNQTFLSKPTKEVIQKMKEKLNLKLQEKKKNKFQAVEYGTDIFISYSRTDSAIAQKLYDCLTHRGINVWFDRDNITKGGKFMEEICQGIRTAKYFIPILTSNIEQEKNHPHVYRTEWDEAIQTGIRYGRTYIIPISQTNLDFYRAAIPERLRQHNAIEFADINDIDSVSEQIIQEINKQL